MNNTLVQYIIYMTAYCVSSKILKSFEDCRTDLLLNFIRLVYRWVGKIRILRLFGDKKLTAQRFKFGSRQKKPRFGRGYNVNI